jgi:PII-like signaling protein
MSAKMLMVFCDETDLWKGEERLYSAIVRKLHRNGIAGATVLGGGYSYSYHPPDAAYVSAAERG